VEAATPSKVSGSIYGLKQCHIPQDLSLNGVGALVKSVWSGGMSVLANFGGESVQQAQQSMCEMSFVINPLMPNDF
jgi:hypothetical protein